MHIVIDSFDSDVQFLDPSQFEMRLLFELVDDELGWVDLYVAECLETCYVYNIEH